ncbi:MAG: DUF1573 domain-containing protein [Planctomycetaceae bacterium]
MAVRGPQAWKVAAFALVMGGGVGVGTAALDATLRPWQLGGFRPGGARPDVAAPRAEIEETTHAFGTVGTGAKGRHAFTIRNGGVGPLTLTRGASSCSCTIGDLGGADGDGPDAKAVVPPGSAAPVTVQWTGKGGGGPFRQQVTILTDDPRRPEIALVVEGTVVPTWKAVPPELVVPRIAAGTGGRASATVFTFGEAPPTVRSAVIDGDDAEPLFAVTTAPLDAEAVADEEAATGGFRVDVELKPGLPIGRLRRIVTVTFDMGGEVVADIPLAGVVGGDLSLAGPGWDSARQTLVLGTVSGRAGLTTQLFITARGAHAADVRPVVREVEPGSLVVTVGEPRPVGSGGSLRIPLEIAIPPGSRPANRLCSESGPPGRIVLDTGHPDAPTLTIPVCVAIGP